MRIIIILLLIPNLLIAQSSPEGVQILCTAGVNAIDNKIKALNAEYKRIQSDLAAGLFCSLCGLSKTELDQAEGFSSHLERVKGNAVSANQAQKEAAYKRNMSKYDALVEERNNKIKNCKTDYQNAVNTFNNKMQEIEKKERQQDLDLQNRIQQQKESQVKATQSKQQTAQEIQQQQQYDQQVRQQQQLDAQKEEQQRYLQKSQQEWDRKLQQQRDDLEKQKARQAYKDQYNDAVNQKAIANIQNTPITKLEVSKVDIKDVKKPASTAIDKGTISAIVESGKIDMEFPELTKQNSNPDIFTDPKPSLPSFNVMETLESHINMIHPLIGGIMKVELTIGVEGKVTNVSTVSSPENKELELKLSSQILNNIVYYFKPAYKNSDPIAGKLSYTIPYYSSDDAERTKKLKAQNANPRTVLLDNGQDYELKPNEELIETSNVTPLSSFSKEVILAKINELKNLPGDTYKKIKGFFDLEFLNNADLTNEKNNIKDTPTPSYSSDRLTMIKGVLYSVRRVNSKVSILTPIEK